MFSKYFEENEIKSEFRKEFISLWPGWLGDENHNKLDEVSEVEWARFNTLIRLISTNYNMKLVDCKTETISNIDEIEITLSSYKESMNKDSSQFVKYIIQELDCILTEEWDYTYILWHKNNGAIEALNPFITKTGLYHFHE